ncbi:MAG: UDP-N-acetylglucosamine 2-epimerase (non-hydrolyzing) [Deltaproteobacteria bacterium]|nr:UDP-N-acetylglucosamine 2-epimerase (non-hydrolyzing) [Deltaproteobacteria bacterium]
MIKVLVTFGTRPEAIKLAPVIHALKNRKGFEVVVCVTSQHREMLDQVLSLFNIQPDIDLNVMKPNQNLMQLTSEILVALKKVFEEVKPDWLIVQGDTTTTFAASLAGFYSKIRVAHVEAGLRTDDKYHPYPEEINRRLTGVLTDFHFAATEKARENLIREGVASEKIVVTGNTVIDALLSVVHKVRDGRRKIFQERFSMLDSSKKLILVTGHRRESFGEHFENICNSLYQIAEQEPDVEIVYPVHLNPNIRIPAHQILGQHPRIHLLEPLEYEPFVYLMDQSYIILTDSGGIQEEAPSLGKPVLVIRNKTERPEGVEAGAAKVIGRSTQDIVRETRHLLQNETLYKKMSRVRNPYGDGTASDRIALTLESFQA